MISVNVRREPMGVERALKRLKKMMEKEGIMREVRDRRYFDKPSVKRRKKSSMARSRKKK